MGEYASRTVYCELILNGVYEELYLLIEKVKADDNRVNIIKIGENDIYLPELSGGYITKTCDADDEPVAWVMLTVDGKQHSYTHYFPNP